MFAARDSESAASRKICPARVWRRGTRRFRWPDWWRLGESPSPLVKALALGQALKSGPGSAASFIHPSGVRPGSTLASRPPQSRCRWPCSPSICGALCRTFLIFFLSTGATSGSAAPSVRSCASMRASQPAICAW